VGGLLPANQKLTGDLSLNYFIVITSFNEQQYII
jgi:hypothetical protein